MRDLTSALAEKHGCEPDNIVLGAGSGEILKNAAHAFTNKYRPRVTGTPTYLQRSRVASFLDAEVRAIPVFRASGQLDLEAIASAARGPSLIFVCNPNNPTSTVHTGSDVRSFVNTVRKASPNTVIYFDEAYHEYVTHPDYEPALELAVETPNVFVSRTFSKCFGMAGMRIGYGVGHRDVIATLRRYSLTFNTNTPGVGAAHAAPQERGFAERERARNSEAKKLTVDFFTRKGYDLYDSQTNFIFVELGSRRRTSALPVASTECPSAATSRPWRGRTPVSALARWQRCGVRLRFSRRCWHEGAREGPGWPDERLTPVVRQERWGGHHRRRHHVVRRLARMGARGVLSASFAGAPHAPAQQRKPARSR